MEGVAACRWVGVAGWIIWSRESKRRYVNSPSTARRMPDLGAPEVVVLGTRNSKARPATVRRFRGISVAFVGGQQHRDEAQFFVGPLSRERIVAGLEEK